MLNNKFAGKIMEQIEKLSDGGLMMNCQIVLCKGINDGDELVRTIEDLYTRYANFHKEIFLLLTTVQNLTAPTALKQSHKLLKIATMLAVVVL